MADRFPEAELVLDDELVFDDGPRRSFLRRSDEQFTQIVREGEVLAGKYRVERIPGRNGLGVIVQVRHMELGQEVTLKFLLPDACAYPEFVQRFVREARAAVKIQGEHVARVTDVGRLESGAPYMVRELLRGPDLAEVVKVRGPLPIAEAVDYVIQACEGVAEGHALSVVHRNIKPTSLVVTRRSDGTALVKVVDFAAAESLHVDPFTERAVSLVGISAIMASLPYLAPEQIRDPLDVDVRADVYSLAAVLFELLIGAPIYAADSAPALLAMVAADPAPPLRSLRPDIPGALEHVVLRCLSKNRAVRYPNVAELVLALRAFASEEAAISIERVVRLAKRSLRPADGALAASPSARATLPGSPAPAPVAPFMPSPSAVPPAVDRGPSGTVMLHVTEQARQSFARELEREGTPTINPYAGYSAPVVIAPQVEPLAFEHVADDAGVAAPRAPLRSAPPPLRVSAAPQQPQRTSATSLPPALPRSGASGMTRSWAVPDVPETPLLTRNRLIAVVAVAACATLGSVLVLRVRAPAPAAAAAPPKPAPPPSPAPVAPASEPAPVESAAAALASASAVPPASAAPSAAVAAAALVAAPPVAAPPAPAPPQVVPALLRRPVAPKPRVVERDYWDNAPAAAPAPEKLARARSSSGPDLFDEPR